MSGLRAVMHPPRYPRIRVTTRSDNPLALVAAVREALRVARVERAEIRRFSSEALSAPGSEAKRKVCARWVRVEPSH